MGGGGGKDEGISLVVVAEAAAVEVGRTYRAVDAVNHHDFGVVESVIEEVDFRSSFHQLVGNVERGLGSKGNVALGRNHNLYPRALLQRLFDGFAYRFGRYEVGVDQLDMALRRGDAGRIGMADAAWGLLGRTIDDSDACCPLGFTFRQGWKIGWTSDMLSCFPVPHGEEDTLEVAHSA